MVARMDTISEYEKRGWRDNWRAGASQPSRTAGTRFLYIDVSDDASWHRV